MRISDWSSDVCSSDLVGDDVSRPPERLRDHRQRGAGHVLLGEHVPQPELDPDLALAQFGDPPVHQRLGIDQPPVAEARHRVELQVALDDGVLVDRRSEEHKSELQSLKRSTYAALYRKTQTLNKQHN